MARRMGKIEEASSDDDPDDLNKPTKISLAEFDWFEFENRARKLMSELLEPIYQRQHDSRAELKDLRKSHDLARKKLDEVQFSQIKQSKRIDNVEKLWEKLTEMERSRRDEQSKILQEFSAFKTDVQNAKYQAERQTAALRDFDTKIEKQKEDVTLAQNMILDMRQGLMEDISDHLKQTTSSYAETHAKVMDLQDSVVEADAHRHELGKQVDIINETLMLSAQQSKLAKELVLELNEKVAQKVEQENYEQGKRFINNDLTVLEQRINSRAFEFRKQTERALNDVQDYMFKYFPVELQATVSDLLQQVLTNKRDLVNLAEANTEKFEELKKQLVPSSVEEQREIRKIEEEVEKKSGGGKKKPSIMRAVKTEESQEGGAAPPAAARKSADRRDSVVQPIKHRKSITEVLQEHRRTSVTVLLDKLKVKVDKSLVEEMQREEEEWDKIKKDYLSQQNLQTTVSEEGSEEASEAETGGNRLNSKRSSDIRKPKHFSEDAPGIRKQSTKSKKRQKRNQESAVSQPVESAGFFRTGARGGAGGGFHQNQQGKRKKGKKMAIENERIQQDLDSLRDSGSYAPTKSSFKQHQHLVHEASINEENMSNFSREFSARTSNRNPLAKTLSKAREETEEDIQSNLLGSGSMGVESKLPSEIRQAAAKTFSQTESVHSFAPHQPAEPVDEEQAPQPIRVQGMIPRPESQGRELSSYNSYMPLDPEQLEQYLQDYMKREQVQDRLRDIKEDVQKQMNDHMEEIEEVVEKHLHQQFSHVQEMMRGGLEKTENKFEVAKQDLGFLVENLEQQVQGWLKKDKRTTNDKIGDLTHINQEMARITRNSSALLQGLDNLASIVACLVEHADIVLTLIQQDDQDRKSIALVGYRENPLMHQPSVAPRSAAPPDFGKTSYTAGSSVSGFGGVPSAFNQSFYGSAQSQIGGATAQTIVAPDKKCLSCAGNKQAVMQAFKIACLGYAPSGMVYRGKNFSRDDMRSMAQCITEACNDVINKQVPFVPKGITTKRYFDDMYIQMKMNEQRLLRKIHTLELGPPSRDKSNQAAFPSLRGAGPGVFSDKQSLESFDSAKLSRKMREKKSQSLFLGKSGRPIPQTARANALKPITLGGDFGHESSNDSLPLISPKRIETPRV